MEIIQIIAVLFALFAISRAFLRFKDNKLTKWEFVFWILLWGAVILVSFIPNITVPISAYLGIGRGIDLIIYISIIVLFYLIFRLYVKTETAEKAITKMVRQVALQNPNNKNMLNNKKKQKRRDKILRQGQA